MRLFPGQGNARPSRSLIDVTHKVAARLDIHRLPDRDPRRLGRDAILRLGARLSAGTRTGLVHAVRHPRLQSMGALPLVVSFRGLRSEERGVGKEVVRSLKIKR